MTKSEAIQRLFLDHRAALVEYATPIVGSRANAEDVVQEAFIRFAPLAESAEIGQPLAYLYRIVRNLSVDVARRLVHESRRSGVMPPEVPDHTGNPERVTVGRDELRRVAAALRDLPERTRRAFELHRLQGLTLQQTAQALGISVTLTHKLVHTALVACMSRLDDGPGGGDAG